MRHAIAAEDQRLLRKWLTWFHQDVDLDHDTLDSAVGTSLGALNSEEKKRCAKVIRKLLESCSNSELKGHLKRSGAIWLFNSKGAREVLDLALQHIDQN